MSIGSSTTELAASLPLSTMTPGGLAILDDGTLIRAVKLESALSPLRMSAKEMERTNRAVQEIPALLPDRQALQLMTSARPFDWGSQVNQLQRGRLRSTRRRSARSRRRALAPRRCRGRRPG